MKVYVVTNGEYSNRAIRGLYSTPERAEEARVLYAGNDVEEYELDAFPEHPPGLWPWSVYRQGDGAWNCQREPIRDSYSDFQPHAQICRNRPRPEGLGMAPSESYYLWARDEEQALKSASEQRAALLASGRIEQRFQEQDAKGYPYNSDCVRIPLEGPG